MKIKKIIPVIFVLMVALFIIPSCKKDKKDTTPPVITLKPPTTYSIEKDSAYVEPGYTAIDDQDGDITSKVAITSNVNIHDTGYYQVKYNVSDKAGNAAIEKTRYVHVTYF